jgi:hypothetical protein
MTVGEVWSLFAELMKDNEVLHDELCELFDQKAHNDIILTTSLMLDYLVWVHENNGKLISPEDLRFGPGPRKNLQ